MSAVDYGESNFMSVETIRPDSGASTAAEGDPAWLTDVLNTYLAIQESVRHENLAVIGQVLADWMEGTKKSNDNNREYGVSFNPFTRIKIRETAHSRILGDLLDPCGSHGQGALFLKVFLERIGYPDPQADGWQVSVETGRVDILLWRHHPEKSAIIIENKSNDAGDQPNQIYRYWHREMYLWDRCMWDTKDHDLIQGRNLRFHIVYLPTDGGKSPADHSLARPEDWSESDNPHAMIPLNYTTLSLPELTALWLSKAKPPTIPTTNTRVHNFLIQYHELW